MSKDIINTIKSLPTSPGVYIFKDKKAEIIYVGKAASLRDRVRSYFQGRNTYARPIEFYIDQIAQIETRKADTVLEAFFMEQDLIKRLQPKYNVLGKDDKSFVYVCITKEDFPRFEVKRKTDLDEGQKVESQDLETLQQINKKIYSKIYGPFTARFLIERALKILRKIFPYHNKPQQTERYCLDYHIGLCPGPYAGKISKEDYRKNIKAIELILKGKKQRLLRSLEKEMESASKKMEFEHAAKMRNLIFTLRHIQDVAMINESEGTSCQLPAMVADKADNKKESVHAKEPDRSQIHKKYTLFRIEGYDISNISGKFAVGSMVVFDDEEGELKPNKSQYRRFRIKTIEGANDVGAMEEVLRRRLSNSWRLPSVILVDGGKGHLNVARRVLRDYRMNIPILAIAKGPKRDRLDKHYYGTVPEIPETIIAQIRDEAHRFAISYHRKVRRRAALPKLPKSAG